LAVLHENGGVLISKELVLTEDFNWIEEIGKNPYVNRGSREAKPQYIGFFDINAGSIMEKVNKSHAVSDYERYMVRFPGVESNFLVGVRGGEFLESVLEEYARVVSNRKYLKSMMGAFDLKIGKLSENDALSRAFTFAAHIVLQVKQF
jgi:hypothetical protein